MKKPVFHFLLFITFSCGKTTSTQPNNKDFTPLSTINEWISNHQSNNQIYQEGEVIKILNEDHEGTPHQKFLVKLKNDKTLLISHNIELSTRIPNLQKGDKVIFYGEYEWNAKGGVVHWTHRDPKGRHPNGYLIHNDKKYE